MKYNYKDTVIIILIFSVGLTLLYITQLIIFQLSMYLMEILYLKLRKTTPSNAVKIIFVLFELNIYIGCIYLFFMLKTDYLYSQIFGSACLYLILNNFIVVFVCILVYTIFNKGENKKC